MAGLFDNESRKYLPLDDLVNGEWFEDAHGYLYIIPQKGTTCDSEGPDNETEYALNRLMEENGEITEGDCERLKVTKIGEMLKRFDEEDGYYHA